MKMKTIERAASELAKLLDEIMDWKESRVKSEYDAGLYTGFKAGAEFAQQWTSIKDDLPNPYEIVLVKTVRNDLVTYGLMFYNPDHKRWYNNRDSREAPMYWRYIEIK